MLMARRKNGQLQLEVAFFRMLNEFLMKQLRKLNSRLKLAMRVLGGIGRKLGSVGGIAIRHKCIYTQIYINSWIGAKK